jgi:DNA-binding NtrC family response regulator
MDKEKELIIKALKKHRSKRKDAALDLGISERTLYRKLKEYDINDRNSPQSTTVINDQHIACFLWSLVCRL